MYVCHYWLKDAGGEIRFVTTDQYMGDIGDSVFHDDEWYTVNDWTEEYLDADEPEDY